jgi:hypothetical protein
MDDLQQSSDVFFSQDPVSSSSRHEIIDVFPSTGVIHRLFCSWWICLPSGETPPS